MRSRESMGTQNHSGTRVVSAIVQSTKNKAKNGSKSSQQRSLIKIPPKLSVHQTVASLSMNKSRTQNQSKKSTVATDVNSKGN